MRKLKTIEIPRLTPEEYKEREKLPLVVVLDDVRSMYNVGSIFRTADACAVEEIILCGITGCPPAAEIHKTALGAEDTVRWTYAPNAVEAVKRLHEREYYVFAVEQCEGSECIPLTVLDAKRKYAIVLGNEVKGVSQDTLDHCDSCLEIPQYGTKHSLNVAVAAGIILWEFRKTLTS
ncbi:MAG: RNA methyltransferase [Prevotella sp.]|nr:RNA methyltransferase [Prevotella sp.]